jgi:hypothetical protein
MTTMAPVTAGMLATPIAMRFGANRTQASIEMMILLVSCYTGRWVPQGQRGDVCAARSLADR